VSKEVFGALETIQITEDTGRFLWWDR